eukprot:TRINITY_DN15731_c0_g2_i1.p2 TRINITY_DN15731_c0_g2~~TRINITY_DN15731_c0_g2_i1.p2  ORF type:complete len:155 (+),score=4.19 TRINITY_DN15731_c0_g2_i1:92-556(+)
MQISACQRHFQARPVLSVKNQHIQAQPRKCTRNPENLHQQLLNLAATGTVCLTLAINVPTAFAVSGGGGISVPLSGQNLSGQDLTRNSYTKATLRGTDFSGANARGVSFFGCIAKGAKFVGTDLSFADLESGFFESIGNKCIVLGSKYYQYRLD